MKDRLRPNATDQEAGFPEYRRPVEDPGTRGLGAWLRFGPPAEAGITAAVIAASMV